MIPFTIKFYTDRDTVTAHAYAPDNEYRVALKLNAQFDKNGVHFDTMKSSTLGTDDTVNLEADNTDGELSLSVSTPESLTDLTATARVLMLADHMASNPGLVARGMDLAAKYPEMIVSYDMTDFDEEVNVYTRLSLVQDGKVEQSLTMHIETDPRGDYVLHPGNAKTFRFGNVDEEVQKVSFHDNSDNTITVEDNGANVASSRNAANALFLSRVLVDNYSTVHALADSVAARIAQ